MIPQALLQQLTKKGIAYTPMCSLKTLSTFRIGGQGELVLMPNSIEQLQMAVKLLQSTNIPFQVLGNGSNVLFGDGLLRGALILTKQMSNLSVKETALYAEAGVSLSVLASTAAKHGLSGLAFAKGIPGTVGGGVFMNAGAYGSSLSAVLTESIALELGTGELQKITDHAFGYRQSIYMQNRDLFCVAAEFSLTEGAPTAIEEDMRQMAQKRKASQPLEYPSGGSYFKRPEGYFAGKLIEDCGLKGYTVGGAAVSEKHAGFLINLGNATCRDVLALEEHVKNTVLARFGVELEREVQLIQAL